MTRVCDNTEEGRNVGMSRVSCTLNSRSTEERCYLQTPMMLHYVHAVVQFTFRYYTVMSSLVRLLTPHLKMRQ
jgi:hypothetical protein